MTGGGIYERRTLVCVSMPESLKRNMVQESKSNSINFGMMEERKSLNLTTDCSQHVVRFVVRFFWLFSNVATRLTTRLQHIWHPTCAHAHVGIKNTVVCSHDGGELVLYSIFADYKVTTCDYMPTHILVKGGLTCQ